VASVAHHAGAAMPPEVYGIRDLRMDILSDNFPEYLEVQTSVDVGLVMTMHGILPLLKQGVPSEFKQLFGGTVWDRLGLPPLAGAPVVLKFALSELADNEMVDPVFSDPCTVSLFEGSLLCDEAVIKRMVRSYSLFSDLAEERDDGMAGLITRISLASMGGEQIVLLHHNAYLMPLAQLDYQVRRNQFPAFTQAEQRQFSQNRRERERRDRWEHMLDEFERGSDPSPSFGSYSSRSS